MKEISSIPVCVTPKQLPRLALKWVLAFLLCVFLLPPLRELTTNAWTSPTPKPEAPKPSPSTAPTGEKKRTTDRKGR